MAQQGTGNVNQIFPYIGNVGQARNKKIKGGTWRGTLIYALEKKLRERERGNRSRGARPPNLLIIALCGLSSLPFSLVPRRSCPYSKHPRSICVHVTKKEAKQ